MNIVSIISVSFSLCYYTTVHYLIVVNTKVHVYTSNADGVVQATIEIIQLQFTARSSYPHFVKELFTILIVFSVVEFRIFHGLTKTILIFFLSHVGV